MISSSEAIDLFGSDDLIGIGMEADAIRRRIHPEGVVHVSLDVKNTGARPGTETVQLYTHESTAPVAIPVKQLRGFVRVDLKPGETKRGAHQILGEVRRPPPLGSSDAPRNPRIFH